MASGNDGQVELYSLEGMALGVRPSHAWSPGVAFSADGRWMATSGPELWQVGPMMTLAWPAEVAPAASDPKTRGGVPDDSVTFSPDGTLLLTSAGFRFEGSWTATTRLLRVADGGIVRDFGATLARRPSFSPAGDWIVAGADLVHVADDVRARLDGAPAIARFLSDGRIVAAAPADRLSRLYCPGRP
jgi:WD40 repeat protein